MTTFTIHTDDVMADAIRRGAAEAGISINKFIQNAIDVTLGVSRSKERPLPDFFNIEHPLTKAEADEIRSVQKEFDVIDPGRRRRFTQRSFRSFAQKESRCPRMTFG